MKRKLPDNCSGELFQLGTASKSFINPSGTHTKYQGWGGGGGFEMDPRYLKNDRWHIPKTLGGVRGII